MCWGSHPEAPTARGCLGLWVVTASGALVQPRACLPLPYIQGQD